MECADREARRDVGACTCLPAVQSRWTSSDVRRLSVIKGSDVVSLDPRLLRERPQKISDLVVPVPGSFRTVARRWCLP